MDRILVVDDESTVCKLFEKVLTRLGHEVVVASTGRMGIEAYRQHRPRATILDLHLPDINGIEVLTEIRALDPCAPVIIWTGASTEAWEHQARYRGVTEFLIKGFSLHELGTALQRVLKQADRAVPAVHPLKPHAEGRRRHRTG